MYITSLTQPPFQVNPNVDVEGNPIRTSNPELLPIMVGIHLAYIKFYL